MVAARTAQVDRALRRFDFDSVLAHDFGEAGQLVERLAAATEAEQERGGAPDTGWSHGGPPYFKSVILRTRSPSPVVSREK